MRTVLVPVDFSSYSNNALDFAYELAKKAGDSRILVLHVLEAIDTQSYNTMGMVDTNDQADLYVNLLMQRVSKNMDAIVNDPKYDGVEMIPHVHRGRPYESISKAIAEHDADLVVMGTLGSSGLDELFIGSNTEKVVRYAKCPVIAIPDGAKFEGINHIVYATDLSEDDAKVIQRLKDGQRLLGAHLHILWVNTPHDITANETMEEKLRDYAREHQLTDFSLNISKAIFAEAGIMNYADEIDADMIALTTGGRKGIQYLFAGSLAENVVNHSCRPVWTYNVGN